MADSNNTRPDDYPRLSRSFQSMKAAYDVVVVGSGYGAGVAASRMARSGKSVAVLELGWEWRPGAYPYTSAQCLKELNISGSSSWLFAGKPTQLFQLILGDGQHAFVAHALGGCSLVNAGVFLEADQGTLQRGPWPPEIKNDPSGLQMYYSRAADMLQPSTYPANHPPLAKLEHLRKQATAGATIQPNSGSGNECTGQNDGSKHSVATTYLTAAWYWGAEIFCGCEVRYIEQAPDGHGYLVYFAWHGRGRSAFEEDFKTQLFWVKANDLCFLGAGSLGTTEILLRSKKYGFSTSPMIGRNMSSNGDMLAFGECNGNEEINGISGNLTGLSNGSGPLITGVIDNREASSSKETLAGYVIEDDCIPVPFLPITQIMLMLQSLRDYTSPGFHGPMQHFCKAFAGINSLILGPRVPGGAIQRTATYLVMSHDSNELTLTLTNDKPCFRGPAEGRSENRARILKILRTMVSRTGATLGYSYFYGLYEDEVTVHPLGGANMSRDGTGREGVTNHIGQVFTGHGSAVHDGLVCCDASVIPTSLGINPLATISALAERSLEKISQEYKYPNNMSSTKGGLDTSSEPSVSTHDLPDPQDHTDVYEQTRSIGWQFTEALVGYVSTQRKNVDFVVSEALGKSASSEMRMFLTIEIYRKRGPDKRGYEGIFTGTVSCRPLSAETMRVTEGKVRFFDQAETEAETTTMVYSLQLLSVEGKVFQAEGHKAIDSTASFSPSEMWKATTKVNVRIAREDSAKVETGVLHISWPSFRQQIKTFRATEPLELSALFALLVFLVYFALRLSMFFFRPFVSMRQPVNYLRNTLAAKRGPSTQLDVRAKDGTTVLLQVYEPLAVTDEGYINENLGDPPILFLPGVTGVGARHSIFALPFQRRNMVEYFTARGYQCYVLTPRWGYVAAALQYISSREEQKPYVVAHCQGSVALAMGLLDGTIDGTQLLGVTANSVLINQRFAYWNSVKAATPLLIHLYESLAGNFFPIGTSHDNRLIQRVLDVVLRSYPVRRRRDICTSTDCHRTSFAFGLCWNNDNLDAHIHENIGQFFAGTHTKILEHITRMGTRGGCLDNQLNPLITPENLRRLHGLPVLFITGTANEVFDPESTLQDYEMLRRRFGEHLYRRF
ncbi:FAD/NAD(P)-binding domain-containing protein [Aspergillus pseudocaelatus]|uniref:Cholesterol oxidase n=1 Tax=Aspergillus pseudocaelatus TaxID=1825620 RepID=A0ABQ6X012_9EURO|nr:FAD/NAD(P)-binding domain-containing protein [Aspergillus pseudocaelatus]